MRTRNIAEVSRQRRRRRIRARISGTHTRPRLAVFRSNRHLSAQLIDDVHGHTIAAVSSREVVHNTASRDSARALGTLLAERAIKAGIREIVFDRGGYNYAGKIRAFADSAREGGLRF